MLEDLKFWLACALWGVPLVLAALVICFAVYYLLATHYA